MILVQFAVKIMFTKSIYTLFHGTRLLIYNMFVHQYFTHASWPCDEHKVVIFHKSTYNIHKSVAY